MQILVEAIFIAGNKVTKIGGKYSLYTHMNIRTGAGAKSYMRKGFPIYEEMREYLVIYE
jgi:hypothetical protein